MITSGIIRLCLALCQTLVDVIYNPGNDSPGDNGTKPATRMSGVVIMSVVVGVAVVPVPRMIIIVIIITSTTNHINCVFQPTGTF